MVFSNAQPNPASQVGDLITQARQLVEQSNFKAAKRLLTEATELSYRALGADHELTLTAQIELAMVHLYLEDAQAALRNGREAFLMAQKHLGPRDEVTTLLAYRLHFILMATSDFMECMAFEQENLHWLLTENPVKLTHKQLQVRQELEKLFKRKWVGGGR